MSGAGELILRLAIAAVFGGITAAIAASKGRSVVGWFFLGCFFPCIALIIILCISDLKAEAAKWSRSDNEQRRLREQLRQERMKTASHRQQVNARLDVHDQELNVDTRGLEGPAGEAPPALPAPKTGEIQWHYELNGRQEGPVGLERLHELMQSGEINFNTVVWNPKLTRWTPIQEIPWLREQLR